MFVGHALLAFAGAALVAERRGWDGRRALTLGVVAGAFAAIPDVDVAYALVGLAEWRVADGALAASTAFWDASRIVHRSVTHSLVVAAVAAPAFGTFAIRDSRRGRLARTGGAASLSLLVVVAFVVDGALAALVTGLFVASGVLVATITARRTAISPLVIALAALWGLWSHPWGDLLTGSPPDLLYPLASTPFASRLVLHSDPTVHLLGAFAVELAVVWLAVVTVCRLTDRSIVGTVDRRATVAAAYGVAAVATTPPTLDVSYHFVVSILGAGALCGVVRTGAGASSTPNRSLDRERRLPSAETLLEVVLTAIAAVTVALLSYTAVYLAFVEST